VTQDQLDPAQLRRLWDNACIRKLAVEYADSVLLRDGPRMESLWATDVEPATPPDFDVAWARRIPGRWTDWSVTMLHVTTHWITFDGADRARGRVQCIVQMDHGDGFEDQTVLYEDDYVRRGDGWLFARRKHRLWYGARRIPDPLEQPASGWPNGMLGVGTMAADVEELRRVAPPAPIPPNGTGITL
jgi:hypothetical protein